MHGSVEDDCRPRARTSAAKEVDSGDWASLQRVSWSEDLGIVRKLGLQVVQELNVVGIRMI